MQLTPALAAAATRYLNSVATATMQKQQQWLPYSYDNINSHQQKHQQLRWQPQSRITCVIIAVFVGGFSPPRLLAGRRVRVAENDLYHHLFFKCQSTYAMISTCIYTCVYGCVCVHKHIVFMLTQRSDPLQATTFPFLCPNLSA